MPMHLKRMKPASAEIKKAHRSAPYIHDNDQTEFSRFATRPKFGR